MRAEGRIIRTMWIALPVAALAAALAWWPLHRQNAQLDRRVEQTRQELSDARRKAERHDRLSTQIDRMRSRIGSYQQTVPNDPKLTELFASLTGAIEQLGLRNPDISSGSIVRRPHTRAMPIRLTFSGDPVDAFGLLREIETMPRLIQPTSLVMETPDGAAENVWVELQLQAFFRRAEEGE